MVLTPEKVVVGFRVAGIGSRAVAQFLDAIILIVGDVLLIWFGSLFAFVTQTIGTFGFVVFMVAASLFLYFILQEWLWNGYTIGKRAMGVRVVSIDGTPLTFRGAV
jgi:uncharacterized RDD family membrane protein YckC